MLAGAAAIAAFSALVACSRSYVWSHPAESEPYNLVVEGFRQGHTWMAVDAPPDLVHAPNPYLFSTYRRFLAPPWNLVDLSYFKGHIYAYFGVTPAVILFWPWRAITGHALHQAFGVLLFCSAGYALALGIGLAAWRRYFPHLGPWTGASTALALASVTTLPVFLVRPGLFEVSISCAFMLGMASIAALWRSWHAPARSAAWLAAASVAYGMAVGARPTLLFGGVILLVPVAAVWRKERSGETRSWPRLLAAAVLPMAAVGACLAAYNLARFGSPLQFGHDYQLSGNDVYGTSSFGPRFLRDDAWLLLFAPLRWHPGFPFVWRPPMPALVAGHLPVEFFFGALTNLPVLLTALFVPALLARLPGMSVMRGGAVLLCLLLTATALPILFYAGTTSRYFLDFLPTLSLLALIGLAAAEEIASGRHAATTLPFGRLAVGVLRLALGFSIAVSWLLAVALSLFYQGAEEGTRMLAAGRIDDAVAVFSGVGKVNPDFQASADLSVGLALLGAGRAAESSRYLEAAAEEQPGDEQARYALGQAELALGKFREAGESFATALKLAPGDADAEANLGFALLRQGRLAEATEHEFAALRLDPNEATAKAILAATRDSAPR
ncbi:MAG TPA: tetratricopeptide repeat protein [Opitutaceae bacterium]|jgi:hypothetical protein|nr:tetratricopeptide repeat protein [Opitutaceae bacterium]